MSTTITNPPRLSYDIVMATRNRPEAVELSLPLILKQTRLPRQVVIVDSSEDGQPIEDLATACAQTSQVPIRYLRSGPGLTHQRNIGLSECEADVVIFPDDDSLLYLDAADQIMQVYEADTAHVIAGVAARPVNSAPPETTGNLDGYEAENVSALRTALQKGRQAVKEMTGFANPFVATGRKLSRQYTAPDWLSDREVSIVPYMTGFRMSFRRTVIASTGFDEVLQKYGWFEDIDASYSALRQGLVVTAKRAEIYHHRVAAARANGHKMGLWAILNRSYVVMKHVRANPQVFSKPGWDVIRLKGYCGLRTLAYALKARGEFGRSRAAGARDGLKAMSSLTDAKSENLGQIYKSLES